MEELQKRKTDCVYFLASPLTCKKGLECEYRHSDTARLNPRDCWYWLSGNCSNPTCAFRHPPLDGHGEVSSESAAGPVPQFPVPTNKTNVPCYFYFSGFCNKGDHCSFSHSPDDSTSALKPLKTASSVPDVLPLDNKTPVASEIKSVPTETAPNEPLSLSIHPKEVLWRPTSSNVLKQSVSPQIPISNGVEAVARRPESLLHAGGFVPSTSPICTDQSSDEEVDDRTEPEERWESSPGFDVLVDGRSDTVDYEDGPDYTIALDHEERELNSHFLGYDFEDQVEYDPQHPEAEILYEHGRYDSYAYRNSEYGQILRGPARERILDLALSRKRKFLHTEFDGNGHICVDLRDHLRKRRGIMDHSSFSRQRNSSRMIGGTAERSQGNGRLMSEVGRNTIGSESLFNGISRRHRSRQRAPRRPRQHFEEKRPSKKHSLPSKASRRRATAEGRVADEPVSFTGPKSLAEIREEKRRVGENGPRVGAAVEDSMRNSSDDFHGPKPLSEILKVKKEEVGSEMED